MSAAAFIPILFIAALTPSGALFVSDTSSSDYPVYPFNPAYGDSEYDDGWSHGSLLSAPNWLLAQIDQNLMSTVLDRGVTPIPTEVPETFEGYIAEGYAGLEGGNYRAAYNSFKKAIELESTSSDAWYGAGIALESQKRYLSALEAYAKAITYAKGASSNWASYAGKGRVLYNLNRFSEAQTALEMAISQYENGGVNEPEELEEIYRLLDEITDKTGPSEAVIPSSAYVPSSA
ncbi:tetratricopeptide repeat protein [Methanospirillum sp. J.3.6.1-F.2.7.3]|uniref:Tetratricopeptide repeat protein n=1 Tax=Methanospirillum purgamenti TaxID=2834276 RepID=A0A8E7AWY7_9EURY|nr:MULTISPECIES: tetratricopeptide repeat protein [Methanospirillum]MDX8549227.1 tetratricopeptide repeat protein [Methanospirillum hungatei]QVV88895.1 tetratricopeptide repeat protein [Methanospirillum sp. J.3.6.1-F.2.7.3]